MLYDVRKYLTPYKLNRPVLEGSGKPGSYNALAVDCPFVFWHNGHYRMLHVGFDGRGYQTALSTGDDLLHWSEGDVLFPRSSSGDGWDRTGVAGVWILKENDLHSVPRLKKWEGKYWMVYHSYPAEGYESGSARIGLAYTDDESLLHWHRLEQPILTWKDGADWEKGGLYKGCLIEEGGKFRLFYNAKQRDGGDWNEQIGLAVSDDLLHWTRSPENPLIRNTAGGWDSRFCADPCILKDGDVWVMYYYGYNGKNAQEGIAFSSDLIHWEKHGEPILLHGGKDSIDRFHAHKPAVVAKDGVLYHFYCAVRESRNTDRAENMSTVVGERSENRCITVATSEEL